jgi:hypothetical protein
MVKAQLQIMQMMIMILAVFFFFILVGLFIINMQMKDLGSEAEELQKEQTVALIETMINSPEFSCSSDKSWCVDEDKVNIMMTNFSENYENFWQVSSIEILKIYPNNKKIEIECPADGCNYYKIYDTNQTNTEKYSAYAVMCKQNSRIENECNLIKFILGVKNE